MSLLIRGLLVISLLSHTLWARALNDEHFTIVEKNHKKGLFDENGKVIIPVAYDDLGWSQGLPQVFHKVIGYRDGNLWGLIGIKNKKICEPRYVTLAPFADKLLIAAAYTQENPRKVRYGLINTKGEQELSFRYYSLSQHNTQLIASILRNNVPTYGVLDQDGDAVVGFDYRKIVPLSKGLYGVYNFQKQTALYTQEGDALTDFVYDSISIFQDHLAIIYREGKQGVIHENGMELIAPQYYRIKIDGPQTVSVLPFNTWHVYTAENQWVRDYTFGQMRPVGSNLYQVKLGAIKTFVDGEGQPVIPSQWKVKQLQGEFAVLTEGNKYGVLRNEPDAKHRVIVPLEYDSLHIDGHYILAGKKVGGMTSKDYAWSLFNADGLSLTSFTYQTMMPRSEGRFLVQRKNHWGYIDTTGLEAISCQYLHATPFSGGVASVDFIEGQGVIDLQGNWKIKPFNYQGARLKLQRIHDDLYIFQTDPHRYEATKYGLINSLGEQIYTSYNKLIHNGHSIWERSEEGKYGLVSYAGESLLDIQYDTISGLLEDQVYIFQKEGKSGILDPQGKVLVDLENNFQELHPMSDEFLGVKINNKFGFVDNIGRLRIANRYDSITHFEDNMAAVKLLGRWGYIDKSEHLIVQPHFDLAQPFQGKLAVVKKENLFGMVNRKGQTVIPLEYSRIVPIQHDRFLVYQDREVRGQLVSQVGLVSDTGKMLIYPKYDTLEDLGNGYVIVRRGDAYGLLTVSGRSTIPLKHDRIIYDAFNDVYLALEEPSWQTLELSTGVGN